MPGPQDTSQFVEPTLQRVLSSVGVVTLRTEAGANGFSGPAHRFVLSRDSQLDHHSQSAQISKGCVPLEYSGCRDRQGCRRQQEAHQRLVEDIIEEVEVVAEEKQGKLSSQEREVKSEEQGQEHPRTGTTGAWSPLEVLEALATLQVELGSEKEKDPKAYLRLQRKDRQRKKRPLNQRSAVIQGIPGIWAKAIMNHLQMPVTISDQDEDMLSSMMALKGREGA
ncbi:testis-specific Y-encoded protein 1-like [Moschus berezovskii]|uniref:testis-specific Y-encoded protein 1-like n=1 Tax=Moschus berezovskii TaxID=68408 RepID=UPI0024444B62|nr:testis-specific Y-encoded protein 1-like [Moschus berezovskii]